MIINQIRHNAVLLLTACISPSGMSFTILRDPNIRKIQYFDALKWYLTSTTLPIVMCENTEYPLPEEFSSYIRTGRLEYLTFNGNNFDRKLGKGYGEGLIMNYALKHSKLIEKYNYIIKISGRHRILNINSIINISEIFLGSNPNIIINEIMPKDKVSRSDMFIASRNFMENYLLKEVKKCDDSNGFWFENALYNCTINAVKQGFQFLYLPQALDQRGISGTSGCEIPHTRMRRKLHFLIIMILYKIGIYKVPSSI